MSHHAHKQAALERVPTAIITVSDSRDANSDKSGNLIADLLAGDGHPVTQRQLVRDEPSEILTALETALADAETRAVIFTGGTGVSPRDVTPDALAPQLERQIPGFGELFRWLSYQEIGSAALLSRALAGMAQGRVIFALPGSSNAVRLALEKLVLPELGHLAAEAVKQA